MLGELFSRFVKRLYICRINRRTKQVQSKEARLFYALARRRKYECIIEVISRLWLL